MYFAIVRASESHVHIKWLQGYFIHFLKSIKHYLQIIVFILTPQKLVLVFGLN